MKTTKAFSLVEALIATVIGAISILAITYSYIFFNNTYQKITDKAKMSASGRTSLQMVAKDLRNAGYKNMNYEATTGQTWDRWIEKIDAHDGTEGDKLRIWYNTSVSDRLEIRYYLKKNSSGETYLVREEIQNPVRNPVKFEPKTIVSKATDFQVFYKIIAPLSRPIIVVLFVITFIGIYSDYILAAIFLKDANLYTVALGINIVFMDDFSNEWGSIAAASVIAATPIAVLFLFFQKQITGGLTAGSIKG